MNKFFLCLSIFSCSLLSAEIKETNAIKTVQDYITQDSIVFLNITGTLYAPSNTLSDNAWRLYFSERVRAQIADPEAAESYINRVKNVIVNNVPKRAIEADTAQVVNALQKRHIPVVGITRKYLSAAYADNFGEITANHLRSIGIDLEKTLSYLKVSEKRTPSYDLAYGMIFTSKKPEGPAILSFLADIEPRANKVVMVDNSRDSLESVQASLAAVEIPFVGLRYSPTDLLKSSFDHDLGTIEFLEFMRSGKILSDEEALRIKQANPDAHYQTMLDDYILGSI